MSHQSMPSPEPETVDVAATSLPDLTRFLEQQITAGFPPELALDLALHELVVRATAATRASASALALSRGNEMVCRAATGLHAPDLGVPLNTRDGLSGACLETRQPQLCRDAQADPLVDAEAAGRLGIRSMLIVPVFEDGEIIGVLEVFSPEPAAFSAEDETLLETLASDCARLRRVLDRGTLPFPEPMPVVGPDSEPASPLPLPPRVARPNEFWTFILVTIGVLAAAGLCFLIGFRVAWLHEPLSSTSEHAPVPVSAGPQPSQVLAPRSTQKAGSAKMPSRAASTDAKPDELVVYDHGKVIFRMGPAPKNGDAVIPATESTRLNSPVVWLAPDLAERQLRSRTEPAYPADALAAHRSGDVVLEILVGEDGSVTSVRTVSGDALLAKAASAAVRNWRYEPYRHDQRTLAFQTDVTLRFALPD